MAKDITKELLATIKETLPETQVGLIKDALNERDQLKSIVKSMETEYEDLEKEVDLVQKKADEFHDISVKKQHQIDELTTENGNLKVENDRLTKLDIERRAELAEGKLDVVRETQQLFLKNTIVREKIQHQVVDESPSLQTSYVNGSPVTTSVGTNKYHKPVTDVKETATDSEEEPKV